MSESIYSIPVTTITGEQTTMKAYEGKTMLIVNVASHCGFTPQYAGLEKLWRDHKDQGLVILGFPCNQFGSQEPGTEKDIQQFCSLTYDVTFPLFSKIEVNGPQTHPLYQYLKKEAPGILGTESIKWNFTKFLVDKTGKVVKRFANNEKPESFEGEIVEVL
jgi:glutathione peroxidase